jgi:hypothetical protein
MNDLYLFKIELDYYSMNSAVLILENSILRWDFRQKSQSANFIEDNSQVYFNGKYGSSACSSIGTIQVNEYTVQLRSLSSGILICLTDGKSFDPNRLNYNRSKNTYCIDAATGMIWSSYIPFGRRSYSYFAFEVGDYITVKLNRGAIRFFRNKYDLGIAFRDVIDEDMFPMVEFTETGNSVKITLDY